MAGVERIFSDKQVDSKIKKEKKRLNEIFQNIDGERKKTIEKLIEDASFMAVMLEETRLIIARDGILEAYQNGENQKGIKKSSAVEVYDKMVNTYSRVIKQLCDLIQDNNEGAGEDPAEEILAFVNNIKR